MLETSKKIDSWIIIQDMLQREQVSRQHLNSYNEFISKNLIYLREKCFMYRTINPNKIPHNQDNPDFSHKNPSFLSKGSADIDNGLFLMRCGERSRQNNKREHHHGVPSCYILSTAQ